MSDLTLGVDVSDVIARLAIVSERRGGDAGHRRVRFAPAPSRTRRRKPSPARKARSTGVAVALPAAGDTVPADLAAALAGIGKGAPTAIAAGTAAAIAEQWRGAARGADARDHVFDRRARHRRRPHRRPTVARRARPRVVGRLARAQSGRARRLSALRRPRSRGRVGRHRAALRVAHQVRRSIEGRRSGQGRFLEDRRGRHSAGRAHRATACRFRSCATPRSTSAWRSPTWRRCSIRRWWCSAASSPRRATSCSRRFARRRTRRLMPQQCEQVRIELSTLGDDAIAIGAARAVA